MGNETRLEELFHLVFNFCFVLWRIVIGSGIDRESSREQWNGVVIASGWW